MNTSNFEIVKRIYATLAVGLLCGFSLAWFLHPDTKVVFVEEDVYRFENTLLKNCNIDSNASTTIPCVWPYIYPLPPTEKEISVLAEKKRCEESGGKMKWNFSKEITRFHVTDIRLEGMSCTRPFSTTTPDGTVSGTETLFEYELTN